MSIATGSTPDGGAGTRPRLDQPTIAAALAGRWRLAPVVLTLALIWIVFGLAEPVFATPRNLSNLTMQIVVVSFLALGLTLVMVVGEIDLSVAALSAVSAAVMARAVTDLDLDPVLAILAGLLVGGLVGFVQGTVVTIFRAPAFIITLGFSLALQGGLLTILPRSGAIALGGTPIEVISGTFLAAPVGYAIAAAGALLAAALLAQSHRRKLAQGLASNLVTAVVLPVVALAVAAGAAVTVLGAHKGVPLPVALLMISLVAMAYLTTQTRTGIYLYAIGGNEEASRRAGIGVRRVKTTAFVLAGCFSAVAGIMSASRTLGVSPQAGGGTLMLDAVAAAVIGGASLFGGRGSVWSALLGALVVGSIANGLDLLGASAQIKLFVTGAILVAAVVLDAALTRGAAVRR